MKIKARLLTTFVCVIFYHLNSQSVYSSAGTLDIDRLYTRIQEVERQVQDKILKAAGDIPIVLIVGGTGSGKTTFVNSLAGKSFAARSKEFEWELTVAEGSELPGFKSGHGMRSETSIPNVWHDRKKNIIYCDCPGFMDTRGPEQEIVNAFAIHQLFRQSSKIKILLAIQDSEFKISRGQEAIQRLNKLISLVPDIDKLKQGLMLVVTKSYVSAVRYADGLLKTAKALQGSPDNGLTLEGPIVLLEHLLANSQVFAFPAPTAEGDYTLFTENSNVIHNLGSGFIENAQSNISFQFDPNTRLYINEMVNKFGVVERKIPDLMTTIQGNYRGKDLAILRAWAAFNEQLSREIRHIDTIDKFIDVVQKYLPASAKNSVQINELVEKIQSCQRYLDFGNKVNAVGVREDLQSLIKPYLRDMWAELCGLIESKEALERQEAETAKKLKAMEEKARIQQAEYEDRLHQQQQEREHERRAEWEKRQRIKAKMSSSRRQQNALQREQETALLRQQLAEAKTASAKEASVVVTVAPSPVVVTVAPVIVPAASAPVVVAPPAPAPPPPPTVVQVVAQQPQALERAREQKQRRQQAQRAQERQRVTAGQAVEIEAGLPAAPVPRWIPKKMSLKYEDIYERFLRGVLVYLPDPESNKCKIEMRVADLVNPLDGTFDLSRCGDAGQYLSIATGYRKSKKKENANKLEIWLAPRFLIEKELDGSASHFAGIMSSWDAQTAMLGIFFNWGNWDNLGRYEYTTTESMDGYYDRQHFFEKWIHSRLVMNPCEDIQGMTDVRHCMHRYGKNFIYMSWPDHDVACWRSKIGRHPSDSM